MPISITGTGTITGISAGGLPDLSITTADIADSAITTAKILDANITSSKLDGAQSGSAPIFGARAWVNFDATRNASGGTDTALTNRFIRASGNVSSVLRNGVGDYTINFTVAMADANYCCVGSASTNGSYGGISWVPQTNVATTIGTPLAGSLRGIVSAAGVGVIDCPYINLAFFR